MNPLEVLLVILVSIWTVIFIVVAAAIVVVFLGVKKAIDKANKILEETEDVAKRVDLPSKVVIASILAFLARNTAGSIKGIISDYFLKGKKKSK
jgi:SNF family Na+-dependent transporter